MVWEVACFTGLTDHGNDIKCIGSHLLQALGAMALKLNGMDAKTIMKIGHWMSSTFLVYIHLQIAALIAGLAQQIVCPIYFQNVGG
jgi:hypothetical protein